MDRVKVPGIGTVGINGVENLDISIVDIDRVDKQTK